MILTWYLNESGVYSFPIVCSPVQGRMVSASTSVYEFDSMVRGKHVYKGAWTPPTDKTHKCSHTGKQ